MTASKVLRNSVRDEVGEGKETTFLKRSRSS